MGVQVLGTGSYVPENVVPNEALRELGCDPEWIVQRSGIHERRHAPADVATSHMAFEAAQQCLKNAHVEPDEIDLLIVGTFTPDMLLPSVACQVQDRLGIRAAAMDLQAACSGFMFSLVTGMQFIANGCSRRALIIGADCNSRICNPRDKRTYPLFGDGAGATILAAGDSSQGLLSYTLGSDGSGGELLCRRLGGTLHPFAHDGFSEDHFYLTMDGRAVFKWAVRIVIESIQQVLTSGRITMDDIHLVVLHQANIRIIDAVAEQLGVDRAKLALNLARYGNTSAASIPLVLDEAHRDGRISRGDKLLLCGFGAGLSWGTGVFQW